MSPGPSSITSLSVFVPVYNEQFLVASSLERLKVLEESPQLERIEVIVVDDCSTDETPVVLKRFREANPDGARFSWKLIHHD